MEEGKRGLASGFMNTSAQVERRWGWPPSSPSRLPAPPRYPMVRSPQRDPGGRLQVSVSGRRGYRITRRGGRAELLSPLHVVIPGACPKAVRGRFGILHTALGLDSLPDYVSEVGPPCSEVVPAGAIAVVLQLVQ